MDDPDFIVVGSGAGGGTVAARLAEDGFKVLVLEAGGDPLKMKGGNAVYPDEDRSRMDYEVPVFHALSTENTATRWDFWVRHYEDANRRQRDSKYRATWNGEPVDGVLYPRAGCLGGCTAHNAMITVYPHNEDWDHIARLTGDASWQAAKMRAHFQRLEECAHRPWIEKWLAKIGINPSRHGFDGWLRTEMSIPKAALEDLSLVESLVSSVHTEFETLGQPLQRKEWALEAQGDPNDWRLVRDDAYGLRYTPLANRNHVRIGTRERLLDVQEKHPDKLAIELDALVTRVLFDADRRAIGVEYLKGTRLYQAHPAPRTTPGERRTVHARREVILAGGAFNTPQLLMLSGVGPAEELARHDIAQVAALPGVGSNLQDRYEVGVVHRMKFDPWGVLRGADYDGDDPQFAQWKAGQGGVYGTNGAILGVINRSVPERPLPDLFCFALLASFKGYFPDYSIDIARKLNYLTWAVLKAHTNNTAGTVRLESSDPTARPRIDFHYFDEGNDAAGEDLQSVVEGVKFVRRLAAPLRTRGIIADEEVPGPQVQTDAEIAQFIRDEAWGHHASCTCKIGADDDPMAVLDGRLRVRGVTGLRVVDASVFPRIPGFFIVSAVYMVGEKAAGMIGDDARKVAA